MRTWSVDKGRGWTRHEEVKRYTKHNAQRIINCCVAKLNNIDDPDSYLQLSDRRDSYQRVIDSCSKYGSTNSVPLTASALIAKEELQQKGLLLITPILTESFFSKKSLICWTCIYFC